MESPHEMAGHLMSQIQERARLYVVVILIFSYHFLFEHELSCTCEHPDQDCCINFILPTLVIFVALLWTDKRCQRTIIHKRRCSAIMRCSHAFFVSCIWPASAFIDADWTVCCFNRLQHNVSCVLEDNHLTEEEQKILNCFEDWSRVAGLSFLLLMFIIALIASLIQRKKKCGRKYNWEETVLEEGDKLVPEKMKEVAKRLLLDKLRNHIESYEWEESFSVGEEVCNDRPSAEILSRIANVVTGVAAQDEVTGEGHVGGPPSTETSHSDTRPLLSEH